MQFVRFVAVEFFPARTPRQLFRTVEGGVVWPAFREVLVVPSQTWCMEVTRLHPKPHSMRRRFLARIPWKTFWR